MILSRMPLWGRPTFSSDISRFISSVFPYVSQTVQRLLSRPLPARVLFPLQDHLCWICVLLLSRKRSVRETTVCSGDYFSLTSRIRVHNGKRFSVIVATYSSRSRPGFIIGMARPRYSAILSRPLRVHTLYMYITHGPRGNRRDP